MPQPYFLSLTPGTTRANFDGPVGAIFLIGDNPIIVSSLGRWVISGNNQSHLLQLTTPVVGSPPTTLASATINTSGMSVGWNYVNISPPIVLAKRTAFTVMSTESIAGADQWLNNDMTATQTTDATTFATCYVSGGNLFAFPSTVSSYAGINFLYDVQLPQISGSRMTAWTYS